MQSPSSEALVLLGRGMPAGEQAVTLHFAAEKLRAEGAPRVEVAFLEITKPLLTHMLAKLTNDGVQRVIIVPAFVPFDRNIRTWLPRFLSGWAATHAPGLDVVLAESLDDTTSWREGLTASWQDATKRPPLSATHRPIYRRSGRSTVPAHRRQVLVCMGPRCAQAGAWQIAQELRSEIASAGLNKTSPDRAMLTKTACQHPCNLAPLVTIQPDNVWYGNLDALGAHRVVREHLLQGRVVSEFANYPGGAHIDDTEVEPDFPVASARVRDIEVKNLLVRPAMHMTKAAAAFMTITNHSDAEDRLVGASSPLAEYSLVHGPQHEMPPEGVFIPLQLPPKGDVVLAPGELHMMLTGLKTDLVEGDPFALELEFLNAGKMRFDLVFHPATMMD